jgi:hypothetical protein
MRHGSILRLVAAAAAALILLVTAACEPTLPTIEEETVPPETQVPAIATETPPVQTETPAVSPSPSSEPTETPLPPTVEEREEATEVAPTEAAEDIGDAVPYAEGVLAAATADLARRLGVTEDTVQTKSLERVLWPDGGLGCPNPSVVYIQELTPGYRILLEVEGETYVYHTDSSDKAILCPESPSPDLRPTRDSPKEVDDGIPWMPR